MNLPPLVPMSGCSPCTIGVPFACVTVNRVKNA